MNIFFQLIIQPLILIIETIYMFIIWIIKDKPGIAVIGVSVAVSFLCLPLYIKAEKIQEKERAIQDKMRIRVTSIKKHFQGDERYMILSTYYRQNRYHPAFALRSSLGLLFQVPFFIAAYAFLSNLEALQGASFAIISDLGKPDALLSIGGISINFLPILMTAINLVSSSIYAKHLSLNEKMQLYVMALLFLVLLYASPAALVLYWTCNNIFSLGKNIVMKIRKPLTFLYILLCSFLALFCIYVIFFRRHGQSYRLRNFILTLSVSAVLVAIPLYIRAVKSISRKWFSSLATQFTQYRSVFILSAFALALMVGIYIPFTVVASSPFEFSFLGNTNSPFAILSFPAMQAFGLFFLWPLCLFYLFDSKIKRTFALAFPILLIVSLSFGFLFPMSHGIITPALKFVEGSAFKIQSTKEILSLVTAALLICGCIVSISLGRFTLITTSLIVLVVSFTGLSVYKATQIQTGYVEYRTILENENTGATDSYGNIKSPIHLSRNGQNVCVFMLDKAISSYLPLIFQERPELYSTFEGFTFFPNCLSYGPKTIIGAPPLYGGYEYTPVSMNVRFEEKMVDKHNEALLVMPTLFKNAGYETLVTDAPFVNYQWVADSEFFRSRDIEAMNLMGSLSDRYMKENLPKEHAYGLDVLLKRNFFVFSLLTVAPHRLQGAIYNEGRYWNSSMLSLNTSTLDSYSVLHYLSELTDFTSEKNSFLLMTNNLTHDPGLLEYPEYNFVVGATDPGTNILGESDDYDKYHSNAAALIMMGRWLDYLRANDAYDNTRIVIVADHGDGIDHPDLNSFQKDTVAVYNPLLLYKDFASNGALKTNETFMTNADTPFLATRGLIEPLENPFTKKEISMSGKEDGAIIPLDVTLHQGFTVGLFTMTRCYNPGASAFHVKSPIMDSENWEHLTLK